MSTGGKLEMPNCSAIHREMEQLQQMFMLSDAFALTYSSDLIILGDTDSLKFIQICNLLVQFFH